jgi:LPXTG-motif cell wall-anchored protein
MKSSTKYLLIGGALVLVGVGAFFVFRKKGGTNKEPEKPNDEVEDDKIVDDEYEDVDAYDDGEADDDDYNHEDAI